MRTYKRISLDPNKMGGVPCIRDLRMPVATIIEMLAEGYDPQQILKEHPELQIEDIQEALHFAKEV
ncbi:MAG: DUF433 domain-containing protein [Bacteroidota bacterium]